MQTVGHSQVVISLAESGTVNGVAFTRQYWKGVGARTGKMFHGLTYVHFDPPNYVIAGGKDREPESRATMPLCEASVQTLRKL